MLGKKRYFKDNIKNSPYKKELNDNHSNSFPNINKTNNFDISQKNKELLNLYNMERSICLSCFKTENKKYATNTYIPCMPFSQSSL